MAFHSINFSKLSAIRLLRYLIDKRVFIKFSTSTTISNEKSAPVKYSVNKAAQLPIAQVIGLQQKGKGGKLWQENDIDEVLKGNSEVTNPKLKLLQLKTQLQYCQANKLPTAALKAKIDELENSFDKYTPPFRK